MKTCYLNLKRSSIIVLNCFFKYFNTSNTHYLLHYYAKIAIAEDLIKREIPKTEELTNSYTGSYYLNLITHLFPGNSAEALLGLKPSVRFISINSMSEINKNS